MLGSWDSTVMNNWATGW